MGGPRRTGRGVAVPADNGGAGSGALPGSPGVRAAGSRGCGLRCRRCGMGRRHPVGGGCEPVLATGPSWAGGSGCTPPRLETLQPLI